MLGTDRHAKELLKKCRRPFHIEKSPEAELSSEIFRDYWKNEGKKSVGMADISFGHTKACAHSKIVVDFESTMVHIPFATS